MKINVTDHTLEDLCIPIAKIRMTADVLDIEHYGCGDLGAAEIESQTLVGVRYTIIDAINEIDKISQREFDRWWNERKKLRREVNDLNKKITELRGGAVDGS